jgi:hypothetical protein
MDDEVEHYHCDHGRDQGLDDLGREGSVLDRSGDPCSEYDHQYNSHTKDIDDKRFQLGGHHVSCHVGPPLKAETL